MLERRPRVILKLVLVKTATRQRCEAGQRML